MTITEVCIAARAEGLSYGQYVSKHRAELAGKRPETKTPEGVHRCKECGRRFTPSRKGHVFCSDICRATANQKRYAEERRSNNA